MSGPPSRARFGWCQVSCMIPRKWFGFKQVDPLFHPFFLCTLDVSRSSWPSFHVNVGSTMNSTRKKNLISHMWFVEFRVLGSTWLPKIWRALPRGGRSPLARVDSEISHFVDQQNVRSKFCWSTKFPLQILLINIFWLPNVGDFCWSIKFWMTFLLINKKRNKFCWSTFWPIWALIDLSCLLSTDHHILTWYSFWSCEFRLHRGALRPRVGWCLGRLVFGFISLAFKWMGSEL